MYSKERIFILTLLLFLKIMYSKERILDLTFFFSIYFFLVITNVRQLQKIVTNKLLTLEKVK
jgi:hypothetical protein